jgi:hypothetical protein
MAQNSPRFSPSATGRWTVASDGYQIPNNQNGLGFTNEGAVGTVQVYLPKAAVGLFYSFAVVEGQTFAVYRKAGSSDLIYVGTTQSSSWGTSSVGSLLVLECVKAGVWMGVSMLGNWSD